ncbi:MAG: phosphoribosylformylglycinamidine synthase subunit PurS [Armatimonadota bacterium]
MQIVELYVELKIPDVTALSAAGTLRRRLGYDDVLRELKRGDFYRISLDVDSEDEAVDMVQDMAENTNIFVNPNKHSFSVFAGHHNSVAIDDSTDTAVNVLVIDPASGSGEAILNALQGRLGYGDVVKQVVTGTLWTLVLDVEDAADAKEITEEIAVTRSRQNGLLMNPHYQDYEMW